MFKLLRGLIPTFIFNGLSCSDLCISPILDPPDLFYLNVVTNHAAQCLSLDGENSCKSGGEKSGIGGYCQD